MNYVELFNAIKEENKDYSLDKILYQMYLNLYTDKPFYEVKNKILKEVGIEEISYYTQNVNKDLIDYINMYIFPEYEKNDKAHGIIHIKEVIRRCFALNSTYKLNLDENMIYAMASFHDLNKYIDSDIHEKLAAKAFMEDQNMKNYFSDDERKIISEAIEDHRSSKEDEPRSEYGKLVSSADRNTTIEMVFIRSFFVALGYSKNNRREEVIEDYLDYTIKRLSKRYSEENPENMFYEDDMYRIFLKDMRDLLNNPEEFKKYYCEINGIDDRTLLVKDYEDDERIFKRVNRREN